MPGRGRASAALARVPHRAGAAVPQRRFAPCAGRVSRRTAPILAAMPKQHTVASDVTATGSRCTPVFASRSPSGAPPDTGIIFRRTDLNPPEDIPARAELVKRKPGCHDDAGAWSGQVATVEHLLAACVGCGVDNAIIELDNLEVPIMDGSSAPFVYLIEQAGVAEQGGSPSLHRNPLEPVRVEMGDKFAELLPNRTLRWISPSTFASGNPRRPVPLRM